ncbi:XyeA family putative rSAM-modified RiPP [Salmonella enterica]|nr:putative rSAM-modified RiPP, XyeA family [Salmonella enterica subsp. diarizonae]ELY9533312.1 XyeA family putative rSAM-modified RiPP [Salmonella enterica]ELY9570266.1 XyeA family putative rSAM-modified RiPP [Salmonella enterica]SQI64269.1 Uncharacterised protein [Salmonella enterica subsp. diarizonae]
MSKLMKEIEKQNAKVTVNNKDKVAARKELTDAVLDSITGGWVNFFAKFTKSF